MVSLLLFPSISSINHILSTKNDLAEPKISAFSGAYVGLKWTVKIDGRNYASFNITDITSTEVIADIYLNGKLNHSQNIEDSFIYDDSWIYAASMAFGTYNDTYGGRELTVCKWYVSTPAEYDVFDVLTGVCVETNYSYYTLILTSWGIYKKPSTIPGYSWIILTIALIGTISCIIKKIEV